MVEAQKLGDFDGLESDQLVRAPSTDLLQAWLKRSLFFGSVLMLLLVTFAAKFDTLQGEATLVQADVRAACAPAQPAGRNRPGTREAAVLHPDVQ